MSTNGIVTNTLSTIAKTPAPATSEAASDASSETVPSVPPEGSGVASGAAEKPDPDLEVAQRFDKLAMKEHRARKQYAEASQKLTIVQQREAKLAEREAAIERFEADPVAFLLEQGRDPLEVAKRFAKAETEEEKRIRKLEEADAARQKKQEEEAEMQAERERSHRKHRALVDFVKEIRPDECPALTAVYKPHKVPELVNELLFRPVDPSDPNSDTYLDVFREKHDRNPTNAEIRESLEYEADLVLQEIVKAHQSRSATAGGSVAQAQSSAQPPSSEDDSGPSSISNQHAAVTTSSRRRPLTLEEKRKKMREELTAALEAEGTERARG